MASQRFCLRWNNHQSNLLSVFDQLFHAETFTDVTLAIDGQCLKAHKVLIIIICSSFRMLFVFHFFSSLSGSESIKLNFLLSLKVFFFLFVRSFFRGQNSSSLLFTSYQIWCFSKKKNVWLRYLRPRAGEENVSQKSHSFCLVIAHSFPHICGDQNQRSNVIALALFPPTDSARDNWRGGFSVEAW